MLTLLLTRSPGQSEAFAADLQAAVPGRFRVVVSPLREVVFRSAPLDLAGVEALVFTSALGVAAFTRCTDARSRIAYCVGAETAAAARAAGFAVRSADGDAEALLALLLRERPGPVFHPRGEEVAADIAGRLEAQGLRARGAVLYGHRDLAPSPEAVALGRAGRIDRVAVFSPRSAQRLAAAASEWALGDTLAVAISKAAAAPLAPLRLGGCRIAAHPSRRGMIEALAAA